MSALQNYRKLTTYDRQIIVDHKVLTLTLSSAQRLSGKDLGQKSVDGVALVDDIGTQERLNMRDDRTSM